ncbi:carbohydrate ABC transporter permease [Clostridium fallax]|uniref:Carbohydrate ABC transporter membrane protein 1, CUT1 family n=1 Tax=Clostridium fallax TaxID=1533 RepID=A0A1M4TUV7_9CLOT|nr:sugar ABC transporter permease [Clostridium fallax]SHE48223.1 carbohydrate ABC transporter membrane protein 1, CUT1 family [Clostridium fallax]SQB22383.1 ABC transporter permease [Clostridium fallax]
MKDKKFKIFLAVCVLPAFLLFCFFAVYPVIKAFKMSMYNWSGLSSSAEFIGFDNFKTLFSDGAFWTSFKNNIFFLVFFPLITIIFSMIFAIILTQSKLREKSLYRVIFFFPNVLSMVVIGVLFTYIYDPSLGILNSFLDFIGLSTLKHAWLGESNTVLWALVFTMVWQAVGYYMVIYMAGLDSISPDLYEVADLEGATQVQKFKFVTLPLLWEVVRVTLVFFITNALNLSFIFVKIMTNGGPDGKSEVLLTYMFKQAFSNTNYGYAMAIGVVVFIFALGLAAIVNKVTEKENIQY